jgi:hypothetical protein
VITIEEKKDKSIRFSHFLLNISLSFIITTSTCIDSFFAFDSYWTLFNGNCAYFSIISIEQESLKHVVSFRIYFFRSWSKLHVIFDINISKDAVCFALSLPKKMSDLFRKKTVKELLIIKRVIIKNFISILIVSIEKYLVFSSSIFYNLNSFRLE